MSRARVAAWCVVLSAGIWLPRVVVGQAEPGLPPEVAEAFEPRIDRGALPIITTVLDLDDEQQTWLEERHARYWNLFATEGEAVRRDIAARRPRPVEADTSADELDRRIREALAATLAEAESMKATGADEEAVAAWHEELRRRAEAINARSQATAREPIAVTAEDFEPVLALLDAWRVRRAEMLDEIRADLSDRLRDDQRERLPDLERRLRRRRLLPAGRLAGDTVDLVDVAAGFVSTPGSETEAALSEYAASLDQALVERETLQLECDRLVYVGSVARVEWEELIRRVDAFMRPAIAVRRLQGEFRAAIAATLPADEADRFDRAALVRAYPRIERPTKAQRLIGRALEIEGLESQTVDQLEAMALECDAEIRRLNDDLIRAMHLEEPARVRAGLFRKARVSAAEAGSTQFERHWKNRQATSDDFVERLRLTLGPWARAIGLEAG